MTGSRRQFFLRFALLGLVLSACPSAPGDPDAAGPEGDAGLPRDASIADAGSPEVGDGGARLDGGARRDGGAGDAGAELPEAVEVVVTLDGAPVGGARVSYGGSGVFAETSSAGRARVPLRPLVESVEQVVIAAHPAARTEAAPVLPGHEGALEIPLTRYDPSDNPAYRFQDPGEPDRRATTAQCAHCHVTMNEAWFGSAHRRSAKNPVVTDLYTGAASAIGTAAACRASGGVWAQGPAPGGGRSPRCYVGTGLLQTVNPACSSRGCDDATELGACAACHAPGIDGPLAGRGLLEAEGRAFEYGVHCDVCHRVESVPGPSAGPGVAGALALHRPSEGGALGLGEDGWLPLTFGPSWDSPNPRMGSVPRAHFRAPELCAGCHQYAQPVLVPGAAIDRARWPSGQLPVQSTFEEWRAGPHAPSTPCQACHMPPVAAAENGADLQLLGDAPPGIAGGWPRPPGQVRNHAFVGPRTEGGRLLELAAALRVETTRAGPRLEVEVTVENVGAGHALPTGEPLRQLFLLVEARCGGALLGAAGGEAIGPLGGFEDARRAGDDLSVWPGAAPGDEIRAVSVGPFVDYDGVGPFATSGRFSIAEKGKRALEVAGAATVTRVDGDRVILDRPLPSADRYFRARPARAGPAALAGRAGASFARVTQGAGGVLAVPHFAAVDVVRDDRLRPRAARASRHVFSVPSQCVEPPEVHARLLYRPLPRRLALERGWGARDRVIAEARR